MDKFYVIFVILKNKNRGFLAFDKGVMSLYENVNKDLIRFDTFEDATSFIRQNKLNNNGNRSYVKSNEDIMCENKADLLSVPKDVDLFYLEDADGQKVMYDNVSKGYFLQKKDVEFCCWESIESAQTNIEIFEKNFGVKLFIKNMKDRNVDKAE